MKQETTIEEAAVIYAHKSFVWPLNKQGQKQAIPPGQIVPSGYSKHQKIATKHFINGAKWQQERSYSEEDMRVAHQMGAIFAYGKKEVTKEDRVKHFEEWFKQFKNK